MKHKLIGATLAAAAATVAFIPAGPASAGAATQAVEALCTANDGDWIDPPEFETVYLCAVGAETDAQRLNDVYQRIPGWSVTNFSRQGFFRIRQQS